jgi:hypothetical protein
VGVPFPIITQKLSSTPSLAGGVVLIKIKKSFARSLSKAIKKFTEASSTINLNKKENLKAKSVFSCWELIFVVKVFFSLCALEKRIEENLRNYSSLKAK